MAKVRVQDDLYMFINQEWLDNAVIPDDKPATGGFINLDQDVEKLLISDFNKMASGELEIPDENVRKAIALFNLAKNIEKRNAEGISPVLPTLEKIQNLKNIADLNANLKDFTLNQLPLPFNAVVDADMKDSRVHCLMMTGPQAILPDTTYYKPEMQPQHDALIGVWSQMVTELLKRTNLSEAECGEYLKDALAFDAIIAGLVKSSEEWSEYTKMYNPMPVSVVAEKMQPLDLTKLVLDCFGKAPENIIVAEPRFLDGFKTLFNEQNFEPYKHWAYIQALLDATSYLSEELREIGAAYYKMLSGVASLPTIEKQAYHLASGKYSEPVGLYYGRKYFGEEAKKDVVEMVKEIIETYKLRVSKNDFLSDATKQKAIVKLDKMEIKMGYPDKVDEIYAKMNFDENGSLLGALNELKRVQAEDNMSKLFKNVDRTDWVMPGHMVNACYNPSFNDITFPAAILQPPFYSIKQSRSENLGGIGAVIGHEISHAFDNNGAKCDENGNLNNWWTDEDFAAFEAKTKDMIAEFEGIELPWGKVNSTLIVSENIADNGGMAVTLEIMSNMPDADYKAYFTNWARVWCLKGRPEYLQLLLNVDVHAPTVLRANMQPRNFDEWYKAFDVKETDKMYIAPEKRVIIW